MRIGIVAGHHPEIAVQIKAALLAKDARLEVVVDEVQFRHDAPTERIGLGDCNIQNFNDCESLQAKGCEVIGFACGCVHGYLEELQTELTARVVDPKTLQGERLSPEAYAAELLATDPKPLAKPFKVGLIGGLGPAATVDLYDKIARATPAKNDQEHFKLVVEQNPQTPDRTLALLHGGKDPTLALYHSAKRLQEDGCEVVIIPCNTAHAFIPYMERHLNVPFVNMQQATLDEIKAKFGDAARIGLMATTGTVQTGIYAEKAQSMELPMFVPDEEHQERVMSAIYGPLGAKAGFTTGQCREDLLSAAEYLVKTYDCNVLILGCTELPLILDEGDFECMGKKVFIIDPTSALARKVVQLAQKSYQERGVR